MFVFLDSWKRRIKNNRTMEVYDELYYFGTVNSKKHAMAMHNKFLHQHCNV
jgi:hypothetical protein